jgi:hypothetical protein
MRKSIDEMTEAEVRDYARELEGRLAALERVDYVYFFHDPTANVIKIGHSQNVPQRLVALRKADNRPLELLGVVRGDKHLKRRLQQQFDAHRVDDDGDRKSEWFAAADELMNYIRAQAHDLPRRE